MNLDNFYFPALWANNLILKRLLSLKIPDVPCKMPGEKPEEKNSY